MATRPAPTLVPLPHHREQTHTHGPPNRGPVRRATTSFATSDTRLDAGGGWEARRSRPPIHTWPDPIHPRRIESSVRTARRHDIAL